MEVIFENGTPFITFEDLDLYDTFICPSLYPKDYIFLDTGDGYAMCLTDPNVAADFSACVQVLKVKIINMTVKFI